MTTRTIRIADWTDRPGPRYIWLGLWSGEKYISEVLQPMITELEAEAGDWKIIADLDNVRTYGPSFLDGSFGVLARKHGADWLESHFEFIVKSKRLMFALREIEKSLKRTRMEERKR